MLDVDMLEGLSPNDCAKVARIVMRLERSAANQHKRDLEIIGALVRVLKDPRGLAKPLAHELAELLKNLLCSEGVDANGAR